MLAAKIINRRLPYAPQVPHGWQIVIQRNRICAKPLRSGVGLRLVWRGE